MGQQFKQCAGPCKKYRSTDDFHIDRSSSDGLRSWCKECVNARKRMLRHSIATYDTNKRLFKSLIYYEELDVSDNGAILVRCHNCGNWFEPKVMQLEIRLNAVEGKYRSYSSGNIYCSDACKEACPVFGKKLYQENHPNKPIKDSARQKRFREAVLAAAGHECFLCDDDQKIEVHHEYPIKLYFGLADDPDNGVPLCPACHDWVHHLEFCSTGYLSGVIP